MMAQIRPVLVVGTNSYVNHADAQTYISGRLGVVAWSALDVYDQYRALITASAKISFEVLADYKLGTVVTPGSELENATCELALYLAEDSANSNLSTSSSNIKSVGAGSAKVEFFAPVKGGKFPEMVMKYLVAGGLIATTYTGGAISSGTDGLSSFDDCDLYTRSQGFGI